MKCFLIFSDNAMTKVVVNLVGDTVSKSVSELSIKKGPAMFG